MENGHSPEAIPPEVPPIEAESRIALSGIVDFIARARLERAERKVEKLEEHDHVIRRAPGDNSPEDPHGARAIRGFGTSAERHEDVSVKPTERLATWHRNRQVKKIRKAQRERFRVSKVNAVNPPRPEVVVSSLNYDTSNWVQPSGPTERNPRPNMFQETIFDATREKSEKKREKLIKQDRGTVASFDRDYRMRPKEKMSLASNERYDKKLQKRIEQKDRRLDKGAEGETVPGKIRRARIERARNKATDLRVKQEIRARKRRQRARSAS
jgi:hypothetical protein